MGAQHSFLLDNIHIGGDNLFLIAGPCVIEEPDMMYSVADQLADLSRRLSLPVLFKSSFIKDNRSSVDYYHGPGIEEGLRILEEVRQRSGLAILSDVHDASQARMAGEVLDVLQIPAYLCMQTSLLVAAGESGKPVNIKHGQFLAPEQMAKPAAKCASTGNNNIILTERGYTHGYNDLIVDPRSFYEMRQTGYPVVYDVTHSIRRYGIPSADPAGGNREYLPTLARAGVAAGVHGLFIEVHPDPSQARCDAASQLALDQLEGFMKPLLEIHAISRDYR